MKEGEAAVSEHETAVHRAAFGSSWGDDGMRNDVPRDTVDEARDMLVAKGVNPDFVDTLIAAVRAEAHNRTTFTTWQGICGHLWNRAVEDTDECPRCRERAEAAQELAALRTAVEALPPLLNGSLIAGFDPFAKPLISKSDVLSLFDRAALAATPAEARTTFTTSQVPSPNVSMTDYRDAATPAEDERT